MPCVSTAVFNNIVQCFNGMRVINISFHKFPALLCRIIFYFNEMKLHWLTPVVSHMSSLKHLPLNFARGYPPLFAFTPLETPFLTWFIHGLPCLPAGRRPWLSGNGVNTIARVTHPN